jgi:hypothetical protein
MWESRRDKETIKKVWLARNGLGFQMQNRLGIESNISKINWGFAAYFVNSLNILV